MYKQREKRIKAVKLLFWRTKWIRSYPYRKYSGLRMQQENTSRGGLQVTVLTEDGTRPVEDAVVRISLHRRA